MKLTWLPERLAVCRLQADEAIPSWALQRHTFLSVTSTAEELSIVCPVASVPAEVYHEQPWRAIKVQGPLDFSLTGILASLANPLAASGISIFAISTFDTDYLLVRERDTGTTQTVLERAGNIFVK